MEYPNNNNPDTNLQLKQKVKEKNIVQQVYLGRVRIFS
jgi:hypothetical protein